MGASWSASAWVEHLTRDTTMTRCSRVSRSSGEHHETVSTRHLPLEGLQASQYRLHTIQMLCSRLTVPQTTAHHWPCMTNSSHRKEILQFVVNPSNTVSCRSTKNFIQGPNGMARHV